MQWWLNSDALNKGDLMVLPHRKVPMGTIKTWVQDGNSWRKSKQAWTSMEAKWCPKHPCCKWRNSILRSGEVMLLGQNVSWWSIKSQKTNRYPFQGSLRAFQRCRRFVKLSYGCAAAGERKIRSFLLIRHFPFKFIHLHVELWWM